MWLALLKNPITKMVFNKATEHFKHKAEKVKTIREAEILACKEVDVARIKSQDKSWKDEILLIWLIGMLTTGWFESTRDNFREWVLLSMTSLTLYGIWLSLSLLQLSLPR